MKNIYKILLAVFSGVLVCFSFPTVLFGWHAPETGIIGWIALVPLFLAIRQAQPRQAFLLTFLSAFIWYGGSLYWVYRAMNTYGHLPALTSFLVTVLLVVFVSIYIALAPMFSRWIINSYRGEMIVYLPITWIAVEFLRNYLPFNGFPWSNIAMSQYQTGPVIQMADVTGIYGIMFIMVFVNQFFAELTARLKGEFVPGIVPKGVIAVLLVAAMTGYGLYRTKTITSLMSGKETVRIGMIQGNIDQADKWDEEKFENNVNTFSSKARELRDVPVDLIVWPEAAYPFVLSTSLTSISPSVLGMDKVELGSTPYTLMGAVSRNREGDFQNSAFLFNARGRPEGVYHKMHLVPFGEYVPYKKLFFFARKLTAPVGNFIAGDSYKPLVFEDNSMGILICYEDIFPQIARKQVLSGAGFLVNITNDAWYGVSSAPYQHLALAVFRAVENRRFLLRATNTGVTAVIDPVGRVVMRSQIFERSLMVSAIVPLSYLSPYTKLGDWLAWGSLAYVVILMTIIFVTKVKKWRNIKRD
jgi:apolipoprotein N-acyltransferase